MEGPNEKHAYRQYWRHAPWVHNTLPGEHSWWQPRNHHLCHHSRQVRGEGVGLSFIVWLKTSEALRRTVL